MNKLEIALTTLLTRLVNEYRGAGFYSAPFFRDLIRRIGSVLELYTAASREMSLQQIFVDNDIAFDIISMTDDLAIVDFRGSNPPYQFHIHQDRVEVRYAGLVLDAYHRASGAALTIGLSYGDTFRYLDRVMPKLITELGMRWEDNAGLVQAHADKCDQYRSSWEKAHVPYHHGAAIYLLSFTPLYSASVRQTPNGFVNPGVWVIDMYKELHSLLPDAEPVDVEKRD